MSLKLPTKTSVLNASSSRAHRLRASASKPVASAFSPGCSVKVCKSVIVFHVPKSKGAASDLQNMIGVVDSRADDHHGVATSATLAVRVKLPVPDGSGKTFVAHLDECELELMRADKAPEPLGTA
jgi:hypothetical protein